jgi:hypothetical protein
VDGDDDEAVKAAKRAYEEARAEARKRLQKRELGLKAE